MKDREFYFGDLNFVSRNRTCKEKISREVSKQESKLLNHRGIEVLSHGILKLQ